MFNLVNRVNKYMPEPFYLFQQKAFQQKAFQKTKPGMAFGMTVECKTVKIGNISELKAEAYSMPRIPFTTHDSLHTHTHPPPTPQVLMIQKGESIVKARVIIRKRWQKPGDGYNGGYTSLNRYVFRLLLNPDIVCRSLIVCGGVGGSPFKWCSMSGNCAFQHFFLWLVVSHECDDFVLLILMGNVTD